MQNRQKVAVALSRIGATGQMAPRIGATHIEAQHRIARLKQGNPKPAQTLASTGPPQSMQDNHQGFGSGWTIQEGQQGSRASGTTFQGRHLDLEGLTLIGRQIHGTERVPQRL
jgi:hypothetical protein